MSGTGSVGSVQLDMVASSDVYWRLEEYLWFILHYVILCNIISCYTYSLNVYILRVLPLKWYSSCNINLQQISLYRLVLTLIFPHVRHAASSRLTCSKNSPCLSSPSEFKYFILEFKFKGSFQIHVDDFFRNVVAMHIRWRLVLRSAGRHHFRTFTVQIWHCILFYNLHKV